MKKLFLFIFLFTNQVYSDTANSNGYDPRYQAYDLNQRYEYDSALCCESDDSQEIDSDGGYILNSPLPP
tara:strand:- start:30 stop:236 length:207 start_codon:yes stop_codon:yes gene_type:complete